MYEKLNAVVNNSETPIESLPLSIAKIIRTDETLDFKQKKQAIEMVRGWIRYVKENNVNTDDLYILRSHIEDYAGIISNIKLKESTEEIKSVQINEISAPNDNTIAKIIGDATKPEILYDPKVIVYGGTARMILRAYELQKGVGSEKLFNAELPISDVDMMIVGIQDVEKTAKKYNSELSGTKIVTDAESEILRHFNLTDITMNQVVVYKGELKFTQKALEDTTKGLIRAVGNKKLLFSRDSIQLPNGNIYLLRIGFYRTLSMLLRGKGNEIIVSQENIDAEKENIGRYWLVLLFAKIFNIQDKAKKEEAIFQWYQIAKDLGSTNTKSPEDFFVELMEKFPGFSQGQKNSAFNLEAQTRWIIGKLVHRGKESAMNEEFDVSSLPQTYTPANITLKEYSGSRDLSKFWNIIEEYKNGDMPVAD